MIHTFFVCVFHSNLKETASKLIQRHNRNNHQKEANNVNRNLIFGLLISGISSCLTSLNFWTTILNLRSYYLTLKTMPLFPWALLITGGMLLLTLPILSMNPWWTVDHMQVPQVNALTSCAVSRELIARYLTCAIAIIKRLQAIERRFIAAVLLWEDWKRFHFS